MTFAVFGLGGYLFYAFLYGAMGALVNKTEDVSKSASGLMMVVVVVYFFSLMQLQNVAKECVIWYSLGSNRERDTGGQRKTVSRGKDKLWNRWNSDTTHSF